MHRFSRSAGALAAVAAISSLTIAGCGSGSDSKNAGGAGPKVTTAATTSTSSIASTASAASPNSATSTADPTTTADTASPTTAASTAGAADPKASCAGLTVQMVALHGAASGTTFADLVIANPGKTACKLPEHPTLEYLDASHRTVPVQINPGLAETPYTLSPGASAAMAIGYGSDGNPPCDAKIAYVRVTPPGAVAAFDGRTHCAQDAVVEGRWVGGTYAAPS